MRLVATSTVEGQVAINSAVISWRDFEGTLQDSGLACSQRYVDWFLNDLKISLGDQLACYVLDSFWSAVCKHDSQQYVVVMHFCNGFSINRVWVPSQLVDPLVVLLFHLIEEVRFRRKSLLFAHVEVSSFAVCLQLSEEDLFVRLSQDKLFLPFIEFAELWIDLQELREHQFAFVDQDLLHFGELFESFWLGKHAETQLHPLKTVLVCLVHSLLEEDLFYVLLPFFQHCADYQNRVNRHCFKSKGKILFGFDS